jgi:hypothetical protein
VSRCSLPLTLHACSTLQIPTADSSRLLKDQLPDLERMCCSTDYMFAYSQELVRVLEERSAAGDTFVLPSGESQQPGDKAPRKAAKTKATAAAGNGHTEHNGSSSSDKQQPSEFSLMCARKFRRLRQELASHALDGGPAVAAASAAHSAAAASASATAAPLGAPPRGEAVCLLGGYHSQHYSVSDSSSSSSSTSSHKRKRDSADAGLTSSATTATASSSSGDGDTDGGESPDAAASDAQAAVRAALVTEQWPAVRSALQTALGHATGRQPVALPAEAVLTLLRCYHLEPLAVSTHCVRTPLLILILRSIDHLCWHLCRYARKDQWHCSS